MRIVAEIPHPRMKITVFKMNDKLSMKFEKNLVEHIIKLRESSPLNDIELLKSSLQQELLQKIESSIDQHAALRAQLEENNIDDEFPEFDEII